MIIEELTSLERRWNLRLNKKKSEILTKETVAEVGAIKGTKTVKYLGVRVTCDRQEQLKISREQIDKNIKMLRWRVGKAEPDVI